MTNSKGLPNTHGQGQISKRLLLLHIKSAKCSKVVSNHDDNKNVIRSSFILMSRLQHNIPEDCELQKLSLLLRSIIDPSLFVPCFDLINLFIYQIIFVIEEVKQNYDGKLQNSHLSLALQYFYSLQFADHSCMQFASKIPPWWWEDCNRESSGISYFLTVFLIGQKL